LKTAPVNGASFLIFSIQLFRHVLLQADSGKNGNALLDLVITHAAETRQQSRRFRQI